MRPKTRPSDLSKLESFDNPLQKMRLDWEHCFLCGAALKAAKETEEHVVPRWLQRKFDLWNERLLLPNKTPIPYRQLKVPCCDVCNGGVLSAVENKMKTAVEGGYSSLSRLDELSIFQWVAKIFYGLLFRDLSLHFDRSDPGKGTIVEEGLLKAIRNTHALLQSVNRPFELVNGRPFSVLVLNVHKLDNDVYDFRDNFETMTIAVRMGDVGIIVALQDHGFNQHMYGPYVEDLAGDKLHPVQFDELYARVTYNCSRLSGVPWYWYAIPEDPEKPVQLVSLPYADSEEPGVLREWDQEEFATQLAFHWAKWGFELEGIFFPPNRVATYLTESGQILLLDPDGREVGRKPRTTPRGAGGGRTHGGNSRGA